MSYPYSELVEKRNKLQSLAQGRVTLIGRIILKVCAKKQDHNQSKALRFLRSQISQKKKNFIKYNFAI